MEAAGPGCIPLPSALFGPALGSAFPPCIRASPQPPSTLHRFCGNFSLLENRGPNTATPNPSPSRPQSDAESSPHPESLPGPRGELGPQDESQLRAPCSSPGSRPLRSDGGPDTAVPPYSSTEEPWGEGRPHHRLPYRLREEKRAWKIQA